MKTLLEKIRTALRDSADLDYIRDSNIEVTQHENFVPAGVGIPCILLKDGTTKTEELGGGMMHWTRQVKIVLFQQSRKQGAAAIMGDGAANVVGLLEMEEDVHEVLDENLLAITGMLSAVAVPTQPESEFFGDAADGVSRKIVTYEYEQEGERP